VVVAVVAAKLLLPVPQAVKMLELQVLQERNLCLLQVLLDPGDRVLILR